MLLVQQRGEVKKLKLLSPLNVLLHVTTAVLSFNVGLHAGGSCPQQEDHRLNQLHDHQLLHQPKKTRKMTRMSTISSNTVHDDDGCNCILSSTQNQTGHKGQSDKKNSTSTIFPESVHGFLHTATRVNRKEFISTFDVGVPWIEPDIENTDILLLHSSDSSTPTSNSNNDHTVRNNDFTNSISSRRPSDNKKKQKSSPSLFPRYSVKDATENCNVVKVIMMPTKRTKECVALVGQWDSFHVHKFMRLPKHFTLDLNRTSLNKNDPFRYASRNLVMNGEGLKQPKRLLQTRLYLMDYLAKLPTTLERLRPIVEQIAGYHGTNGTDGSGGDMSAGEKSIIVMIYNFGQSELLMNFVCAARSRTLEISNVLVFATDNQTVALCNSLGLHVFDVQDAFGTIPIESSQIYGDAMFSIMMMAKVYVVHLVNYLGYHVLYQDVDIIWYTNPLSFFQMKSIRQYDMIFQDDGSRVNRYLPYSANTGFYYVRSNTRTELFFSMFVRLTDLIEASKSHQDVFIQLMSDHTSWRGLKVKVLSRDDSIGKRFPGGYHYHVKHQFMKDMVTGKNKPYIFHMSWTKNKNDKNKFIQQLGEWYLHDTCTSKTVPEIEKMIMNNATTAATTTTIRLTNTKLLFDDERIPKTCCSIQPIFQCHYRDKPSKHPCYHSPNMDPGPRNSFW